MSLLGIRLAPYVRQCHPSLLHLGSSETWPFTCKVRMGFLFATSKFPYTGIIRMYRPSYVACGLKSVRFSKFVMKPMLLPRCQHPITLAAGWLVLKPWTAPSTSATVDGYFFLSGIFPRFFLYHSFWASHFPKYHNLRVLRMKYLLK